MRALTTIALVALSLSLAACGKSAEEKAVEELKKVSEELAKQGNKTPESVEDAVEQLTKAFTEMSEPVETVAAKDLKAMLPEAVAGLERVRASASKDGAMGFSVSTAEAVFSSNDERVSERRQVTVSINDIGSMQGMARLGMGWLNIEVDEEWDGGFRRTTEYKGHKSIENFEDTGASTRGQKSVFIDGRFLVDVSGENVSFDEIEKIVGTLPLDDLETMSRQ